MELAFVFPGQGSQYVKMGKEIVENFTCAEEVFNKAAEVLSFDLKDLCFEGPEERLMITSNTQPALLTVSYAIYKIVEKKKIKPKIVAGHSLGEYTANVVAKTISFEDAVRLVRKRGELMQKAGIKNPGGMAAIIGLDIKMVENICQKSRDEGLVEVANFNSPVQIVVSGEKRALDKAMDLAISCGARKVVKLSVSSPFHSSLMKEAADVMSSYLDEINFRDAEIPIISNFNAEIIRSGFQVREALKLQMENPVRWCSQVERMKKEGIDTFLEIGPGKVLSGLIKKIIPEAKVLNIEDMRSWEKVCKELNV